MRQRVRSVVVVVVVVAVAFGLSPGVSAQHAGPVPDSCRPHPRHVLNPGCVPAATSVVADPAWTLPNLVPDVADVAIDWTLVLDPETTTYVQSPLQLQFDTRAQNFGTVPLELVVDDAPTSAELTPVSQCVAWAAPYVCRERVRVGGINFHEPHGHFHFNDFAAYELRRLDAGGNVDYSGAGLVSLSDKMSFCLIDSQRVRDGATPIGPYQACGLAMQGVSAGWADIYTRDLPGQQFTREGLVDGRYAIVVRMDYADHIHETDETDNVVEVIIELSDGANQVSIVEKRYP